MPQTTNQTRVGKMPENGSDTMTERANETARDTRDAVAGMADRASEKASDLADRARDGAETVQRKASDMADTVSRNASEMADTVSSKLKTVGVDTDVMVNAAKDQASELQRLLTAELQARPMRALGIAAAVGVFVGLMTAR